MRYLPPLVLAMAMVYWLHHYVIRWFSPNVTSVIDLLLFVTILVATNSLLKNLRGD
jgi:hypothetical protein